MFRVSNLSSDKRFGNISLGISLSILLLMNVSNYSRKRGKTKTQMHLNDCLFFFEYSVDYNKLKSQWSTIDAEQESHFSKFRSRRHRIEKDVVRTDRTHPFYSQEGGPGLQMLQVIYNCFLLI